MSHPNAIHYRCIESDYGGTYTHRRWRNFNDAFDPETLPAIGTFGCTSCVAVYMKLSPTTCFFAHINAAHYLASCSPSTPDEELYDQRAVTDAEGGYVRDETIRLLRNESARSKWPPVEQIEQVVLVCPVMRHPISGATLSGKYVVQGIREFLGRPDLPVDTESEGFVVTHDTGRVVRFPWLEEVEGHLPIPDNGVDFVAHQFHGDEWEGWYIDIGRVWEARGGLFTEGGQRRFTTAF